MILKVYALMRKDIRLFSYPKAIKSVLQSMDELTEEEEYEQKNWTKREAEKHNSSLCNRGGDIGLSY